MQAVPPQNPAQLSHVPQSWSCEDYPHSLTWNTSRKPPPAPISTVATAGGTRPALDSSRLMGRFMARAPRPENTHTHHNTTTGRDTGSAEAVCVPGGLVSPACTPWICQRHRQPALSNMACPLPTRPCSARQQHNQHSPMEVAIVKGTANQHRPPSR